jgi:hypothetical protein
MALCDELLANFFRCAAPVQAIEDIVAKIHVQREPDGGRCVVSFREVWKIGIIIRKIEHDFHSAFVDRCK